MLSLPCQQCFCVAITSYTQRNDMDGHSNNCSVSKSLISTYVWHIIIGFRVGSHILSTILLYQ